MTTQSGARKGISQGHKDVPSQDATHGSADRMVGLIAQANMALPDDDRRKIRPHDVRMLRRLADQASSLDRSLVDHAAERRPGGDQRGHVSPEALNTARWAERLATALEAVVSAPAAAARDATTAASNEYLDDQSREFNDADGTRWHVRVEQGGGARSKVQDAAPVAVLIFRAIGRPHAHDLRIAADAGEWNLASLSEARLRGLLREAQTHGVEPTTE